MGVFTCSAWLPRRLRFGGRGRRPCLANRTGIAAVDRRVSLRPGPIHQRRALILAENRALQIFTRVHEQRGRTERRAHRYRSALKEQDITQGRRRPAISDRLGWAPPALADRSCDGLARRTRNEIPSRSKLSVRRRVRTGVAEGGNRPLVAPFSRGDRP
jgi:hypothetical protein